MARVRETECRELDAEYAEQLAAEGKLAADGKALFESRKAEAAALREEVADNLERQRELQTEATRLAKQMADLTNTRVDEVTNTLETYKSTVRSVETTRAAEDTVQSASKDSDSFSLAEREGDADLALLQLQSSSGSRLRNGHRDRGRSGGEQAQGVVAPTREADGPWRRFVHARSTADELQSLLSELDADLDRAHESTERRLDAVKSDFSKTDAALRTQHGAVLRALEKVEEEGKQLQRSLVHAQEAGAEAQQAWRDHESLAANLNQFRKTTGTTCRRNAAIFARDTDRRGRVAAVAEELQRVLKQVSVGQWPESLTAIESELRRAGYDAPLKLPELSRDCTYTVQSGDSLAAVGDKFGVPAAAVRAANAERLPGVEYPPTGMRVVVPELHMDDAARKLCTWRPHLATKPVAPKPTPEEPLPKHVHVDDAGRVHVSEREAAEDAAERAAEAARGKDVPAEGGAALALTGGQYLDAGRAGFDAVAAVPDGTESDAAGSGVTVEAWVRVRSAPDAMRTQGIVSAVVNSPVNPATLEADAKGPYEAGWFLGVKRASAGCQPRLRFVWGAKGESGQARMSFVESASISSVGEWYHVAAVYDASASPSGHNTMRLFINGRLRGVGAGQWGPLSFGDEHAARDTASLLLMGRRATDAVYATDGEIGDVVVYRRALPQSQIKLHAVSRAAARHGAAAAAPGAVVVAFPLSVPRSADDFATEGDAFKSAGSKPAGGFGAALTAKVGVGIGSFSPVTPTQYEAAAKVAANPCAARRAVSDRTVSAAVKPLELAIGMCEAKAKVADAAEEATRAAERDLARAGAAIEELVDEETAWKQTAETKLVVLSSAKQSLASAQASGDAARVQQLSVVVSSAAAKRDAALAAMDRVKRQLAEARERRDAAQAAVDHAAKTRRAAVRAARALPALRAGVDGILRAETEEALAREALADWKAVAAEQRADAEKAAEALAKAKAVGDAVVEQKAALVAMSAKGKAVRADTMVKRADGELEIAIEANRLARKVLKLPQWIFEESQRAEEKIARGEAMQEAADAVEEEEDEAEAVAATAATGAVQAAVAEAGLGKWEPDARAIKLARKALKMADDGKEEEEAEEEMDKAESEVRVDRSGETFDKLEREAAALSATAATGPAPPTREEREEAAKLAAAKVDAETQWDTAEEIERERAELGRLAEQAQTLRGLAERLDEQGLREQAADARADLSKVQSKIKLGQAKIERLGHRLRGEPSPAQEEAEEVVAEKKEEEEERRQLEIEAEEEEEGPGVEVEVQPAKVEEPKALPENDDDAPGWADEFRLRGAGVALEGANADTSADASAVADVQCTRVPLLRSEAEENAHVIAAEGVTGLAQEVKAPSAATVSAVSLRLASTDGWPHLVTLKVFAVEEGVGVAEVEKATPTAVMAAASPVTDDAWYAFEAEEDALTVQAGQRLLLVLDRTPLVAWKGGMVRDEDADAKGFGAASQHDGTWTPIGVQGQGARDVLAFSLDVC